MVSDSSTSLSRSVWSSFKFVIRVGQYVSTYKITSLDVQWLQCMTAWLTNRQADGQMPYRQLTNWAKSEPSSQMIDAMCLILPHIINTLWSNKHAPILYVSLFSWTVIISIIFGTEYTEVTCDTTVFDISTSPSYCCYIMLGKFELCNNDYRQKLPIHKLKNIQFTISSLSSWDQILQQLFTITFSLTHTGLKSLMPFNQWNCQ